MSSERQSVLILHNPKSGSRYALDVIRDLASRVEAAGFDVEAYESLDRFHENAREQMASGRLRAVVAAGGDGTAAAVATRVSSSTPLWLCPLGTENLLARYLGMGLDPDQAAAAISRLKTRPIDAGLANGQLFLIMVGIGFDAEVVRQVHTRRTGHIHRHHYWLPIARTLLSYRFPRIRLVPQSELFEKSRSEDVSDLWASQGDTPPPDSLEAAWYFLLNLPKYATGLDIARDANGNDGLIDICGFRRGGFLRGLFYYARLRWGNHHKLADFSHCRAAKFRLEPVAAESPKISYQLDGDWGGYLPLDIESLPGRLCVIEPV